MSEHTSLYSIGYGNLPLETVLERLRANDITYLIDVRARPRSRFRPEFNDNSLRPIARDYGITYVHMGPELGGRPDDPALLTDTGHVNYDATAQTPLFRAGMERLESIRAQELTAALMCSEGRPELCHRSRLIGVELAKRNIPILHFDPDGELVSQEQVMLRLTKGQLTLEFEDIPSGLQSRKPIVGA
jgi:uncharacterized protein (DUF488 family)